MNDAFAKHPISSGLKLPTAPERDPALRLVWPLLLGLLITRLLPDYIVSEQAYWLPAQLGLLIVGWLLPLMLLAGFSLSVLVVLVRRRWTRPLAATALGVMGLLLTLTVAVSYVEFLSTSAWLMFVAHS